MIGSFKVEAGNKNEERKEKKMQEAGMDAGILESLKLLMEIV